MHVVYMMTYSWIAVFSIMYLLLSCHRCWQSRHWGCKRTMGNGNSKDFVWTDVTPDQKVLSFNAAARRYIQLISFIFLSPPSDFDPNLSMMAGITPMNPMMPGLGIVPAPLSQDIPAVKEIIHCKSCTLFPPNPSKSLYQTNPSSSATATKSHL